MGSEYRRLEQVVLQLAAMTDATPGDVRDEHERWGVYEHAIRSQTGLESLRRAVSLEEDKAVASSVVLRVLELVDNEELGAWIETLPPDSRALSERRAEEIRMLRRAHAGDLLRDELQLKIDDWSDWLQLRLARVLHAPESLAVLSERGRTRRTRNAANETLKTHLK